jgi:hypothetical protein
MDAVQQRIYSRLKELAEAGASKEPCYAQVDQFEAYVLMKALELAAALHAPIMYYPAPADRDITVPPYTVTCRHG